VRDDLAHPRSIVWDPHRPIDQDADFRRVLPGQSHMDLRAGFSAVNLAFRETFLRRHRQLNLSSFQFNGWNYSYAIALRVLRSLRHASDLVF
jgi:hypothetical protein